MIRTLDTRRTCACGGVVGPAGECEQCRRKRLQRFAREPAAPAVAPPIVDEVLRSSGRSLDPAVRVEMEARLGHDFSRVRVHTDARAAASAHAVDAIAYTVGRDVVFGADRYRPATPAGKRLLAHELTHVVQQSVNPVTGGRGDDGEREAARNADAIASPQVALTARERSAPLARADAAPTVTVQQGPGVCSLDQHRQIYPAIRRSIAWLDRSIAQLTGYFGVDDLDRMPFVRDALRRHFHTMHRDDALAALTVVQGIRNQIATDPNLRVECHGASDTTCGAAGAYVQGSLMVFCPSFFGASEAWQSEAIVHESSHAWAGTHDIAYGSDRLYVLETTLQAFRNAESFALLVEELGTGKAVVPTPPKDSFEDCPAEWRPFIRQAIALAQRWNRDAQTETRDRRPGRLQAWADLQRRYLGGVTAAQLDRAQRAYDRLEGELKSDVDFECEPSSLGGRCGEGAETYWFAIWSDFHLCPVWLGLPGDEARTLSMLAGLYGYKGDVGDSRERWNLASLARDLHSRFHA